MITPPPNRMKTGLRYALFVGCMLLTATGRLAASAATSPPAVGETLPDIRLEVPADPVQRSYLGLEGSAPFAIPEIDADIVIVEIFSMY